MPDDTFVFGQKANQAALREAKGTSDAPGRSHKTKGEDMLVPSPSVNALFLSQDYKCKHTSRRMPLRSNN